MKKIINLLLIFILTISFIFCSAQSKYGKISYKDNSLKNPSGVLYFDQNHSLYIFNNEKKAQATIQKTSDGSTIYPANTIDSIANKSRFIYYDRLKKTFYNNMINDNVETIIKDAIKMSWTVSEESKIILGYNCYKAVGQLYGKEYEAWFTNQLDYPYGPIKINGLSGIILELNSNSIGLNITAEKIYLDDRNVTKFIKDFNKKYNYSNTKTREEYNIILRNQIKDFENDINSKIPDGMQKTKFKDLNCNDCNNKKE